MNECPTSDSKATTLSEQVNDLASQCVKCGLCLPHCPTYQFLEDENESPRGRIELLKAIANQQLSLSTKVEEHLDRCLTCRACETVCPAKVQYGTLITKGRTLISEQSARKKNLSQRLLHTFISRPTLLKGLHWLLWLLEASHIRALGTWLRLPQLIGLDKLNQFLPKVSKPNTLKSFYPAIGPKQGTVGLFIGCIQSLADTSIYPASIHLLTHIGFDVHVPSQQTCCGAIGLHAGELDDAEPLMQKNVQAFESTCGVKLDHVVSLATGCGTVLHAYPNYLNANTQDLKLYESFSQKIVDISTLIVNSAWPKDLKLKNFEKKIAVHSPCTLRHGWHTSAHPISLLKRIPTAHIYPIQHPHCCGAAGTYMLDFPETSTHLGQNLLDEITPLNADVLVTSNIGCALHLTQMLKAQNPAIEVMHPITLLSNLIFF